MQNFDSMRWLLTFIAFSFLSVTLAQETVCHPRKLKRSVSKSIQALNNIGQLRAISLDSFLILQYPKRKISASDLKPLKKALLSRNCRAYSSEELELIYLKYTYFKIQNKDTCLIDLLQPIIDSYQQMIDRLRINQHADSINGVYIPKNLDDCFSQLNSFWNDSIQQSIKTISEDSFVAESHFGIGLWIRNNWGLWGSSRLSAYFSQLEIFHPDDMSGIILRSYHRKLNNKDIKLEEQIAHYHEYWKKNN